jgi:hypothetical protein
LTLCRQGPVPYTSFPGANLLVGWLKETEGLSITVICNLSPFTVTISEHNPALPLLQILEKLKKKHPKVQVRSHPNYVLYFNRS